MIRCEFSADDIAYRNLHPETVFEKERELAGRFVSGVASAVHGGCPVCRAEHDVEPFFDRWGFRFVICPSTWTVFIANKPEPKIVNDYFYDSDLARFRASREFQEIATTNRKALWERQLGWMEGRIGRHLGNGRFRVTDWGSKFVGWVEFLQTSSFVDTLSIHEPLPPIREVESSPDPADVVCLIDGMQRETNPDQLLARIAERMRPGGLLILTCRAGTGFDVLVLRERSDSVFPLDHIFLPSPEGVAKLLETAGFELLEISTPGLMDMNYVKSQSDQIPQDQYLARYMMSKGDDLFLERMQGFLQRNNLSSHLRCVARRRTLP